MSDETTGDKSPRRSLPELAPPDYCDPVIEFYKKDVDRSLLRENLKLTPAERMLKFQRFMRYVRELKEAGEKSREKDQT